MPYHYSPWGSLVNVLLCLALCDALTPRRRYPVYRRRRTVYYESEAPEPAPLPALALEVPVPEPPKAEVVERV
jgi:hypothetical protein